MRRSFLQRGTIVVPTLAGLAMVMVSNSVFPQLVRASSAWLYPHLHPFRFGLMRPIRYLAVPVSLVKLLKVLNREEV